MNYTTPTQVILKPLVWEKDDTQDYYEAHTLLGRVIVHKLDDRWYFIGDGVGDAVKCGSLAEGQQHAAQWWAKLISTAFVDISPKRHTTRYEKQAEAELTSTLYAQYPALDEFILRVYEGTVNKIRYIEEVLAINDVNHVLEITLQPHESARDWLQDKLTNQAWFADDWFDPDSFADRLMIRERYGLS